MNACAVANQEIGAVRNPWPNLTRFKAQGFVPADAAFKVVVERARCGLVCAYGADGPYRNIDFLCALEVACEQFFCEPGAQGGSFFVPNGGKTHYPNAEKSERGSR